MKSYSMALLALLTLTHFAHAQSLVADAIPFECKKSSDVFTLTKSSDGMMSLSVKKIISGNEVIEEAIVDNLECNKFNDSEIFPVHCSLIKDNISSKGIVSELTITKTLIKGGLPIVWTGIEFSYAVNGEDKKIEFNAKDCKAL